MRLINLFDSETDCSIYVGVTDAPDDIVSSVIRDTELLRSEEEIEEVKIEELSNYFSKSLVESNHSTVFENDFDSIFENIITNIGFKVNKIQMTNFNSYGDVL